MLSMLKAKLEQLSCFQLRDQVTQTFLRIPLSGLKVDPVRTFLAHLQLTSKRITKLNYKEWCESCMEAARSSSFAWTLTLTCLKAVFPAQFTLKWQMTFRWFQSHMASKSKLYASRTKGKAAFDMEGEYVLLPYGSSKNERNAEWAARRLRDHIQLGNKSVILCQ